MFNKTLAQAFDERNLQMFVIAGNTKGGSITVP
jgi:hypothetical protein